MTALLVDTSVLIKWFHSEGETELAAARTLRAAHLVGDVEAHVLDLAIYQVGNVLVRTLSWPARDVADQIEDLLTICGMPLTLTAEWLRDAASLAAEHRLTYYDAAWAAAARGLAIPLVSADRRLRSAALAETPTDVVARLRLTPR